MTPVAFRPRRLGHVNLYVGDLERSIAFYEQVCGIELVRREKAIGGGFHSNGNTHHDIGMIEVSKGVDRIGRDGKIQIAASRGTAPGLNHLGWEMENEVELVAAYRRLQSSGLPIYRTADHLISHSLYIGDPDGNVHEFYADAIPDWRTVFNLDHDDLVTAQWDPLCVAPSPATYYPVEPTIRRVDAAPLHPKHISGATLATRDFDAMHRFFVEVGGLTPLEDDGVAGKRRVVLAGGRGHPDLTLIEAAERAPTGLRLFSFVLAKDDDPARAAERLSARGATTLRKVEDARRRAVVLTDPDGFQVEFYRPVAGELVAPLAA